MAPLKKIFSLFGILLISAWVLGSVMQAGAETLKGKTVLTATKDERVPVKDETGHYLGVGISEGLAIFENGEIAKQRNHGIVDSISGKGGQSIGYNIYTFEDGSTVVTRSHRIMVPGKGGTFSSKTTTELIKGTGRFEGIKGTSSATGKNFTASEGEASRAFNDFTWTYTLPGK